MLMIAREFVEEMLILTNAIRVMIIHLMIVSLIVMENGGSAEIDECGVCGGLGAIYDCGCNDIPLGYCDCNNNIYDCAGVCGGARIY